MDDATATNEALHEATKLGDSETILKLLAQGAEVNSESGSCNWTPLHIAAARGDCAATELLLQGGAQVNSQSWELMQPIHLACKQGCVDVIHLLLNAGATVNCSDAFGHKPLHFVARYASAPAAVNLLVNRGADIETVATVSGDEGGTPLYFACARPGHKANVEALIGLGAQINVRIPRFHRSPLEAALFRRRHDIVKVLLQCGADPNSRHVGSTPRSIVLFAKEVGSIHNYAISADRKLFKTLLAYQWDVCSRSQDGSQVLHYLAKPTWRFDPTFLQKSKNIKELVEDLIKAGADVNALNYELETPLMLAIECHNDPFVSLIFERGLGRLTSDQISCIRAQLWESTVPRRSPGNAYFKHQRDPLMLRWLDKFAALDSA